MEIVTEIDLLNGREHLRIFKIPVDPAGSFDYKSRTAINAFTHSLKCRNYKPTKKKATHLYHFQDQQEWDIARHCYMVSFGHDPRDSIPVTECSSIFEFFKIIGFDNKTKKWESTQETPV